MGYYINPHWIVYDDRERDAFLHPDPRKKVWYVVARQRLEPFLA